MKNEKGSALLTVMLAVFVVSAIGAAVLSFILGNFKLRLFDNEIRRAEYEAEEMIDKAYLYAQVAIADLIDKNNDNGSWKVTIDAKDDSNYKRTETLGDGSENIYYEYDGNRYDDIENFYKKLFPEQYKDKVYDVIKEKIEDELIKAREVDTEKHKTKDNFDNKKTIWGIDIDSQTINSDTVEIPFKIYYRMSNGGIVDFSVDFIITVPTYENVKNGTCNPFDLIGITNWTMKEWEYL